MGNPMQNKDPGWIYVLTNPSMPGLVKIGKTERDPEDRIEELSAATGVPTPFNLAYKAYVSSCSLGESLVHDLLSQRGYRVSDNREFFNAPLHIAIEVVVQVQNQLVIKLENHKADCVEIPNKEHPHISSWDDKNGHWRKYISIARAYHYGWGDYFQDIEKAIENYKLAAKLGSSNAFFQLGSIYLSRAIDKLGEITIKNIKRIHPIDEIEVRKVYKSALDYFQQGGELGNAMCYSLMAFCYKQMSEWLNNDQLLQPYFNNYFKCWDRIFACSRFIAERKEDSIRLMLEYCNDVVKYEVEPQHIDFIKSWKNEIEDYISNQKVIEDELKKAFSNFLNNVGL